MFHSEELWESEGRVNEKYFSCSCKRYLEQFINIHDRSSSLWGLVLLQRFAGQLCCKLEWLCRDPELLLILSIPYLVTDKPPNSVTLTLSLLTSASNPKIHVISLMVAPSPMDTTVTPAATSDLEIRISRIADPNIGMISILAC